MHKIIFLIAVVLTGVFADALWLQNRAGRSAYESGNYEEALAAFDSSLVIDRNSTEARFNRALAMSQLGQVVEAAPLLDGLVFEDSSQQAELSYLRGKLAEAAGQMAIQGQDFNAAREAYASALGNYANTLAMNSEHEQALQNIELTASILEAIPDPDEQPDEDQENEDGEEGEEGEDQESDDQENQDGEDQNEDGDQQDQDEEEEDESDEEQENQEDESEEEPEDEEEDEGQQDEPEEENEDESDEEEEQPQPEESSEEEISAMDLLERYGDDASELNRPPEGQGVPVRGGKDW